jgi:hypothetical protein
MGHGIDALGLIASTAVLAIAAGMLLGRLEDIIESSRERQPARLRAGRAAERQGQ